MTDVQTLYATVQNLRSARLVSVCPAPDAMAWHPRMSKTEAGLFPARLRYSGISVGYQVAGLLGGGFAPIVATALIRWSGGASWPVATYPAVTALTSLVAVCLGSDRYKLEIHRKGPMERRLAGEPRRKSTNRRIFCQYRPVV